MISEDGTWCICDAEDCEERIKNYSWGYIKADNWLFQKDGKSWCPNHIPAWYKSWKGRGKGKKW